jgi:hypothetical protein
LAHLWLGRSLDDVVDAAASFRRPAEVGGKTAGIQHSDLNDLVVVADVAGVGNRNILASSVHEGSAQEDSVQEDSTAVPPSLKKKKKK